MSVAERLVDVRRRIVDAGGDLGRITIVAVTKGFGPEACREALAAGLDVLGENRVQEALHKMEVVRGARWHLIGHLQTNKVRQVAGRFELIQSIDSLHVAEALAKASPRQPVLIEVNVAREAQKTGVDPREAVELVAAAAPLLEVRGLMAMGPAEGDPRPAFDELRGLRDEARARTALDLSVLSMGMSGDFEVAVAAGSTMLRLGQVLFGPRPA